MAIKDWRLTIEHWLLLGLFLLVGCGSSAAAEPETVFLGQEAGIGATAVAATAVAPTATLPSPLVNIAAPTTAVQMPSFAPADPTAVSARNAEVIATATAQALPTEIPTITPTPQPTFTPPALPFTSSDDHFWLRRPIAEGGVVWTDKIYSYGSTRGGTLRPHHGVEFYVPAGTEIFATASGTVVVAGDDSETIYGPHANFYGKLVIIELDTSYNTQPVYTLYAHLSQVLVSVGQRVAAQELIALSGATGVADGAHLHFEVRVGENSYSATRNPLLWLYPFPENGVVVGRVLWPDGTLAEEVPITLRRIDAPSRYHAATSYAGNSVNGDDVWQENFAFDDVAAGYYEVEAQVNGKKYKQEVWVFAYRTSFVEIVLGN